jgi:hypothetical protein
LFSFFVIVYNEDTTIEQMRFHLVFQRIIFCFLGHSTKRLVLSSAVVLRTTTFSCVISAIMSVFGCVYTFCVGHFKTIENLSQPQMFS